MKHNSSIIQVAARLFNTPLLIHPDSLNTILNVIGAHIGTSISLPLEAAALPAAQETRTGISAQGPVAVIPVCGILSHKQDEFAEWVFGDTSYETIRAQFQAALADPNITGIVFDVDSPGGEVKGCFDLVDEIYNARGIKPISAVVNETAFSAAYAIASAAEKIYLPRTGSVGSVGVIMVHMDQSQYDEKLGVKYTPIYAGARKNDFDRHSALSPEAAQVAQGIVESHYELFVKTTARNRGISPQIVRDTQAALYYGKNAVDIGLADSVAPWAKAMSEITRKKTKGGSMQSLIEKLRAITANEPAEAVAKALAEMGFVPKDQAQGISIQQQNLDAIAAALDLKPEQLIGDLNGVNFTAIQEKAEKSARAQIISVLEVCALGGQEKLAMELVTAGATKEDAQKKVHEAKAAGSRQQTVKSTVAATTTGEMNPLIEDASRRAEALAKRK